MQTRTTVFAVAWLAAVLQISAVSASAQMVVVKSGDTQIQIPTPVGFREISQLSPEGFRSAERDTPPGNRLIAAFYSLQDASEISKGRAPRLRRYMFVQVARALEQKPISSAGFLELQRLVRTQYTARLKQTKGQADSLVATRSREVSNEYGVAFNLKVGELAPLGIFLDTTNGIGFAIMAKVSASAGTDKPLGRVSAGTTLFMRVNGKLLYAYVFGTYEKPDDLAWARAISTSWVNDILAANNGYASRGEQR
jgi:hypothetical protein